MHHQMAFDSTGLAKKAQNRLRVAPQSAVNKGRKKSERILDVKHIKDTQGKETETFARLTTYHKQKMPQSESFSFVRVDAY